jgi:hypothetical protein
VRNENGKHTKKLVPDKYQQQQQHATANQADFEKRQVD